MADNTCLVCGKSFDDEKGGYRWMHDGSWYTLDDIGCRNRFIGNPAKYLEPATS